MCVAGLINKCLVVLLVFNFYIFIICSAGVISEIIASLVHV